MKKTIKVLRIISQCKAGGVETIALNYYKNLDHSKVKMDFLCYDQCFPVFNKELNKFGDKVIVAPKFSRHLYDSIMKVKSTVKEGKYDIVHIQLNTLNVFPLIGAKLGGAKIIISANHSTANLRYETKKSILKYFLRPFAGAFATHYAACSKYAGAWCFGEKRLNNGEIEIIHNAIDLDKFEFKENIRVEVRNNEKWNNRLVIGNIGRFVLQKNHKFLIDIFEKVLAKRSNALLVLVGEGPLKEDIRKYAIKKGLQDYVQFLGVREDVYKIMQGMDLFVFPSLYEGLGNVVTEAQAAGLTVVASDEVPDEVKLTDLVHFIPLKEGSSIWADYINSLEVPKHRISTRLSLEQSGYDIVNATRKLENYYFSLVTQRK